jgi:very-short-patch-repair endonuclease
MQIHNRKNLKQFRKELRNNLTPAEATLWKAIQKSQIDGRKFRRQHSVGNYILDFYCPGEMLAIELDGQEHFTIFGSLKDQIRDEYLKTLNIKVLRFENKEVFNNLEGILEEIKQNFRK